MKKITFPCLETRLVPRELVVANGYNPNSVSGDKLDLLARSIADNGWCFPIVTIFDPDREVYVIVDGFHRRMMAEPEWLDIPEIPIVVLEHGLADRMTATIQFNKARGVHQVDLDAEVIRSLIEQGLTEEEIAARCGIDLEAVHRYKQLTGIAALFARSEYSRAWEMIEEEDAR